MGTAVIGSRATRGVHLPVLSMAESLFRREGYRVMRRGSPVRLDGGDHVVHFYDAEGGLVEVVGSYLAASVLGGETVIVIATPQHLAAFVGSIAAAGADIEAARAEDRLVLLDADETLSLFMQGAVPDQARFGSVVGHLFRKAAATGQPVRAYGEMVARLWQDNNAQGAVDLERLWNELGAQVPLGLFCAYPRSIMLSADEGFGEVCHLHSAVVEGAPSPFGAEWSQRFLARPEAARRARAGVSATLSSWGLGAAHDDIVIAAAELASNAIAHAGGDFTIGLARSGGHVRLSVGDKAAVPLAQGHVPGYAEGGRGLAMVAAIADGWGYDLMAGGKLVWADFDSSHVSRHRL